MNDPSYAEYYKILCLYCRLSIL